MKHSALRISFAAVILLALAATPCGADEVALKSGGTLLGKAHREAGQVRVELEEGVLVFPEAVVECIVPGISPAEIKAAERADRLEWMERRLEATGLTDAQALYAVALDARLAAFPEDEVRTVLGFVLGADPDHAGAHADLGEVRHGGRWVLRAEARDLADRLASMQSALKHHLERIDELEAEVDRLRYEVAALEDDLHTCGQTLASIPPCICPTE